MVLNQLKKALKIDYDTDDTELMRLMDAAVSWIQSYTGLTLQPTKKVAYLSQWTKTLLPEFPVQSITSVKYTDSANTTQTMTDFWLDKTHPPSIYLDFGSAPTMKKNTFIEVTYVAGYADTPKEIEQCIVAFVGAWYNHPEAYGTTSQVIVPMSAQFILDALKVRGILE